MHQPLNHVRARRKFLQFLAASPLFALAGLTISPWKKLMAAENDQRPEDLIQVVDNPPPGAPLITNPDEALDVFDLEAVARKQLPPAHFGYLATGGDNDATLLADREGFMTYEIRDRRLIDVSHVDMSIRLFGTSYSSPIVLAPVSSQKAFHPECEIASAKGANSKGNLMVLSTASSSSLEDVVAARRAPVWFQLYPTDVWDVTRDLVRRAEMVGCPVLVVTVDHEGGFNWETEKRFVRLDSRQCSTCHENGFKETLLNRSAPHNGNYRGRPMFHDIDVSNLKSISPKNLTWDIIKRLKDTTKMKLLVKGILTRSDAQLAVENGADGVIVSNHGGRAGETNRSTIETLPEVIMEVGGKIPVLVDSGFRRGTDVFKALALGATAVLIGRPYVWGLAAFGQLGVESALDIMHRELLITMSQAGTISIDKITHECINRAPYWVQYPK